MQFSSDSISPVMLTVDDVAALLKVSTRTVWRLRSGNKLPKPVEVGGSVRWNVEAITQWISSGCPKPTGT